MALSIPNIPGMSASCIKLYTALNRPPGLGIRLSAGSSLTMASPMPSLILHCLYITLTPSLLIFLVYVDDIILIGNNDQFLKSFQQALSSKFSLKNLGQPSHFLGIELLPTQHGLFLSQHHYIRDFLLSTNMQDAKWVCTPMSTSGSLQAPLDTPLCDVTDYRKIIGSLQYLSLTRPDISFSVSRLSQYLNAPTTIHMQAAKRILRYLKGTIDHGLHLTRDTSLSFTAFCDSDWAGDSTDYKSTAAYIIYFGSNPISWSCKKQRAVVKSSTEAEYRTIASTTMEVLWLQQLFKELHILLPTRPTISQITLVPPTCVQIQFSIPK